MQNLLCVTIYIINEYNQFVLLHHKKLNKWVPPGGKVDSHEIPDVAAFRECKEETGLDVKLIGDITPCEGGLLQPFGIQYNVIKPGELAHYDLIYLAKPIGNQNLIFPHREAHDIGWYDIDKIKKLDTFPSVLTWCDRFLNQDIPH